MLRAIVIFNQIGFPIFTYVEKKKSDIHPAELLDLAEDLISNVSLSDTQKSTNEKYYFIVSSLPKRMKLVAIFDIEDKDKIDQEKIKQTGERIVKGDQEAIKELLLPFQNDY